jgi:excisionase family DNA binding protein
MESKTFMTIRETAKTGILPEHTLRMMNKAGLLPAIKSGNRVLINYPKLEEMLNNPKDNFIQ